MSEIKSGIKRYIKNIDFKISNPNARVCYVVIFLVALFSGLNIYTNNWRVKSEIRYVQSQFDNKERKLMQSILSNCPGNLADKEVVRSCYESVYKEKMTPLKKKHFQYRLMGTAWFAFWGGLIFLALHISRQTLSLAGIYGFFRELWVRAIWRNVEAVIAKFRKK